MADVRMRLIDSFARVCEDDERILAAFLGGSFATGTFDEYSDVDLYALVRPSAYDGFLADHREFLERLGMPVFLEHFGEFGFDMLVFMFDTGVQGELAVATPDRFLHIHGGPHRVLVDKEGLLEGVEFPRCGPSGAEQLRSLRQELQWFWRDLSLCSVAMSRDRLWTAAGYIESMRRRCADLLRLEKDFAAWPDGYEKLEDAVGAEELLMLEGSFSTLDRAAMAASVDHLVTCYRRVASELARRHGLAYPYALEEVVLRGWSG